MSAETKSQLLLYRAEDGHTRIQCRFENENVWLTQALMAELFQTTPQNITLHLRAIYAEGELREAATCKEYLQVRSEGGRQIQRSLRKAESEFSKFRAREDAKPTQVEKSFEDAVKKLPKINKPQRTQRAQREEES